MTYNATFYQSLQKLLILSMIFTTFVYFERLDKYWFNFLVSSPILSQKGKFHNLFKHLLLGIKHSFTVVYGREPLIVNYFGKCQDFDRSQSLLGASSARPGKRNKGRIKWRGRGPWWGSLSCVVHHQSSYLCRLMTRPHNDHLRCPSPHYFHGLVQTNVFVLIVNLHLHFPFIILTSD